MKQVRSNGYDVETKMHNQVAIIVMSSPDLGSRGWPAKTHVPWPVRVPRSLVDPVYNWLAQIDPHALGIQCTLAGSCFLDIQTCLVGRWSLSIPIAAETVLLLLCSRRPRSDSPGVSKATKEM
jgi:hypothetical protein